MLSLCKLEQVGTKERDGRILAKEAKTWEIEGQKRIITSTEYQRLLNKSEMEGSWRKKD